MQYYGDLLRKLQKESTTGVGMYFVKKCLLRIKQSRLSENETRFFMMCAVSANDGLQKFLEQQQWEYTGFWQQRLYFSRVKSQVPMAVKAYISCLLVLLGSQKKLLLKKLQLSEAEMLQKWEYLFYYEAADKVYFNRFMQTVTEKDGLLHVFAMLGEVLFTQLQGKCLGPPVSLTANGELAQRLVSEDAYIVTCRLKEMK